MVYTYDYFQKSAEFLRERAGFTPEVALVLGSGLGPFARATRDPVEVAYRDIPHFLVSTVDSHAGKLIFGLGCGLITVLIRVWGNYPEGVSFYILLMNILNPYICEWTKTKPFGGVQA